MKKLSFLTIATAMLLGWSSMQAQDALEVTASQAQVTQDFDSMWNGSEATLDLPQMARGPQPHCRPHSGHLPMPAQPPA